MSRQQGLQMVCMGCAVLLGALLCEQCVVALQRWSAVLVLQGRAALFSAALQGRWPLQPQQLLSMATRINAENNLSRHCVALLLCCCAGRWDEAAADYQAVLAVAPGDPSAWNNLGNTNMGEARLSMRRNQMHVLVLQARWAAVCSAQPCCGDGLQDALQDT